MVPLETAHRNGIGIDEFPMQKLHGRVELVDIEGEGNDRSAVDAVLRRRRLGERVGNDGEICGNLHASSIAHARDATRPYDASTPVAQSTQSQQSTQPATETTPSARRSHGTGSFRETGPIRTESLS